MTLRKPLVLINGLQFALPPGDTLDAVSLSIGSELVNNAATGQPICTPVCAGTGAGAGGFQPARANAIGTARCLGLIAVAQIAPNAAGGIRNFGILSASVPEWNVVTGLSGGLVAGSVYYLSDAVAGRITTTPPNEVGRFCTRIGQAITPTSLLVFPGDPIGL